MTYCRDCSTIEQRPIRHDGPCPYEEGFLHE